MFEEYRQRLRIVRLKWTQQFRKPRVYVGYLAGGTWAVSVACRYAGFSSGLGVQIIEPWILLLNYWGDVTLLTLGFLAIVSDAPFVDSLSQGIMLKCKSKMTWNESMLLYILLHSLCYWAMIMIVSSIPCLFVKSGFGNQWSRTIKILINALPTNAITEYRLNFFSTQLLKERTPFEAAVWSYILAVLFSYTLALFVYMINLKTGRPLGAFWVLFVLLYSVLIIRDGGMNGIPYDISPMARAIVDYHGTGGMNLITSLLIFLVFSAVFIIGIKKTAMSCDYREVNGNRLW